MFVADDLEKKGQYSHDRIEFRTVPNEIDAKKVLTIVRAEMKK